MAQFVHNRMFIGNRGRNVVWQWNVLPGATQAIGQRIPGYLKKPGARVLDSAEQNILTHCLDEDLLQKVFGFIGKPRAMAQVATQLGHMAGPGGQQTRDGHVLSDVFGSKIALPEPQRHVHQADHHRHFDQRPDDRGKGGAGIDAVDRHGDGDGQFEVVAGGGEGQRRALLVAGAERLLMKNENTNMTTK